MNKTWADFKVGTSYQHYEWDTGDFVTVEAILNGKPIVFDPDSGCYHSIDYISATPSDFTEVRTPREFWLVLLEPQREYVVFTNEKDSKDYGSAGVFPYKEIIHVKEVINGK